VGRSARASTWDLAVESVEEALDAGLAPPLERLGRLGQLGTLPSLIGALERGDPGLAELVDAYARERHSLGFGPRDVVGELLAVGRVLGRSGVDDARCGLERCILAYVDRTTDELADRARRDPLTGLLNHRAFHATLAVEAARARRYRGRMALVLIDLDHFKATNDTWGHREGDRRLRAFAAALAGTVRSTDFAGRVGGDEFAVLLVESEPASLAAFLHRLSESVAGEQAFTSGAAFFPGEAASTERLLELADRRLYEGKVARPAA
jgi:diguanylate cyclase (GGDEF)-like protein